MSVSLCRLACVTRAWSYVCAAAYVSLGKYGIHKLHTRTFKGAYKGSTLEYSEV